MNRQLASRALGERAAQMALLRLLCAVSIWRTAMTRVLPLCGASAWWTALLCLLPGFGVAALLRWTMHLTRTSILAEAFRACLGKAGAAVLSAVLAVLLLAEGASGMTAMITVFTQGVGTRGTQFTLAVLTGAVLAFSLHREGLPRAAYFLRWGMAAAAVLLAAFSLGDAHLDGLFPLYGEGVTSVWAAWKAGASLAWPVALLLTVEPSPRRGRLCGGVLPVFGAVGAVLLTTLTILHERLVGQSGLAAWLLLPMRYAPNALRVGALCLMLLAFFLAVGAAVQLAATQAEMACGRLPRWTVYVLLAALVLTQTAETSALWAILGAVEPWLLASLAMLAVVTLPIALIGRTKP